MPESTEEFAAERREHGLTVTSFAVLGLLAMREWTSYELAQQMKRSFSYFWPRAERRIYDEPKRLADAGYVTGRPEVVGRRPRTCWVITPKGRQALKHWLGERPSEPPTMEFEGMLKVFLAEHGGKQQLLDTIESIRSAAQERAEHLADMSAEISEHGGQFPDRVHINALAMRYVAQVNQLTLRWAAEADGEVRSWHNPAAPGEAAREKARAEFARFAGSPNSEPTRPPLPQQR